jgi:hypothetical protein
LNAEIRGILRPRLLAQIGARDKRKAGGFGNRLRPTKPIRRFMFDSKD